MLIFRRPVTYWFRSLVVNVSVETNFPAEYSLARFLYCTVTNVARQVRLSSWGNMRTIKIKAHLHFLILLCIYFSNFWNGFPIFMKLGGYCADVHCFSPHASDCFWNAVVFRCNRLPKSNAIIVRTTFLLCFYSSPNVRFIYHMLMCIREVHINTGLCLSW